jgi:SWI/SNF-related matrix-associated actin-dependent regulator 1 of chromatin subfamily A
MLTTGTSLARVLSKGFSLKVDRNEQQHIDYGDFEENFQVASTEERFPPFTIQEMEEIMGEFFLASQPPQPLHIILPNDIELFHYQYEGTEQILNWFREGQNVLLGDEMGLGKTFQALAVMNSMLPRMKSILVVCPRSLVYNWRAESKRVLVDRPLDDLFCIGTPAFIDIGQDFLICSYEVMAENWPILAHKQWDMIVFDEFHFIKNTGTKRYKGLKQFCDSQTGAHILGLTGTPIVNYPIELWPLLNILDKKRWRSLALFEHEFTFGGVKRAYVRNPHKLQKILRDTILIRRMKKEVMPDLPPVRRKVIEFDTNDRGVLDLIEQEMNLWRGKDKKPVDALTDYIMEMNSRGGLESDEDFAAFVDGMKYNKKVFFEQMARLRHEIAHAKMPQVKEHIGSVIESHSNGEKFLIFAHHKDIIEELEKFVNETYYMVKGLKRQARIMTGAQSIAERQQLQDDFQGKNDFRCLIGNSKVMGLGFNLTKADHGIFVEGDWVPSVINQSEARMQRIGSTAEKILIEHLVLNNSLDAYMAKKVVAKQRQIDRTINKM